MQEIKWLNELILFIYGVSVIAYFIDFIQFNRKAQKVAFWLLRMVWYLQTIFLLYQIIAEWHFPVATIYEAMFFYSWILVSFALIVNRFIKIPFFMFFINLLGFFILLLHVVSINQHNGARQGIAFIDELLIAHITLALSSYVFFAFSFVFSIMYLLQYKFLKDKKNFKWLLRFGDLKRVDQLSFLMISIAVPILLLSIVFGLVWAYISDAVFYWYDIKTIGSFVVFFVYLIYLLLRTGLGYQGKSITLFNTGAFLFLLVNFFLFNIVSNFHF